MCRKRPPRPIQKLILKNLLQEALSLAESAGVAGRDVTPFVLSRVAQLTGGKGPSIKDVRKIFGIWTPSLPLSALWSDLYPALRRIQGLPDTLVSSHLARINNKHLCSLLDGHCTDCLSGEVLNSVRKQGSTKSTQPPLLCLTWANPPTPLVWTSFVNGPQVRGRQPRPRREQRGGGRGHRAGDAPHDVVFGGG